MRFNQKSRNSRFLVIGGRLFWLSFLFPCLGVAQGLEALSLSEEQQETQAARDEPDSLVVEENRRASIAEKEDLEVPEEEEHQPDFAISSEEQEPMPAKDAPLVREEKPAPKKEHPMTQTSPQTDRAGSNSIGVQIPTSRSESECYSEPVSSVQSPPSGKFYPKNRDCWPPPSGWITLDFLYFRGMMENLRFAEKSPQVGDPPVIKNVEPHYTYDPGGRVSVGATMDDYWEVGASWMFYKAHPSSKTARNENFGIYTSLPSPGVGTTTNYFANNVSGDWKLWMNVCDFEFKKPFCIGKTLMFNPVIGVQGALFRQYMHAHYENINPTVVSVYRVTTVKANSRVWGVGPEVALETRFLTQNKFDLFVRTAYSAMLGNYDAKTIYSDIIVSSALSQGSNIVIKNTATKLFSMFQVMAAVSKRWSVGQGLIELMLGWETQFWTGVNRWDFYSTLSMPSSNGGNLMLAGPFARFNVEF